MKSSAATVNEYLDQLTPERREAVSTVREVVLANLPAGYQEMMDFGMIAYVVPLERYPQNLQRPSPELRGNLVRKEPRIGPSYGHLRGRQPRTVVR